MFVSGVRVINDRLIDEITMEPSAGTMENSTGSPDHLRGMFGASHNGDFYKHLY